MRNKAHDLATYTFREGETLLLDANVWLYLFPAPSGSTAWFATKYSAAFKSMLTAKARLVLDATVLSEYVNAYSRIECIARGVSKSDFKAFRKSGGFQAIGQGAALFARRILKLCARHDHPFADADVERILADFETGAKDFNDGLLAEACRRHGWKLVTNDSDFIDGGIEVITSHPVLLRACT